jgi:predicted MFS family arabinose efflux permease
MERVDSEWHSLAYGSISMAMGLGFGSTSLLGGYLIEAAGYRTVFLVGAMLSTVSTGWIWAVLRARNGAAGSPNHGS